MKWIRTGLKWTALLLLTLSVAGCATTPEPIYIYKTVEVVRDRYVPIPESLTQPVEIVELPEGFDVYQLGAAYKAAVVRLHQCNGFLTEIASIIPPE